MKLEDIKKDVRFAQRLLRLAGYDCGKADGVWGSRTETAWQRWQSDARRYKCTAGSLDERSEVNLETLLPSCQDAVRRWFHAKVLPWAAQNGCTVKIIQGTRSYQEQDRLYAQGRTAAGRVVTKARGGYSNHNFGVALDLGIFVGARYEEGDRLYRKLHEACGEPEGFLWGGGWKSMPDTPHYQLAKYGSTTENIRRAFIS